MIHQSPYLIGLLVTCLDEVRLTLPTEVAMIDQHKDSLVPNLRLHTEYSSSFDIETGWQSGPK